MGSDGASSALEDQPVYTLFKQALPGSSTSSPPTGYAVSNDVDDPAARPSAAQQQQRRQQQPAYDSSSGKGAQGGAMRCARNGAPLVPRDSTRRNTQWGEGDAGEEFSEPARDVNSDGSARARLTTAWIETGQSDNPTATATGETRL